MSRGCRREGRHGSGPKRRRHGPGEGAVLCSAGGLEVRWLHRAGTQRAEEGARAR